MFYHFARNFMAQDTRTGKWNFTLNHMKIRMAYSAGLGFDENLISLRTRHVEFFDSEWLIWLSEHHPSHERTPTSHVIRSRREPSRRRNRVRRGYRAGDRGFNDA
uniref:Uncharacterized protein n=1 Tax=Opuntia streptacantha TaxID=393608 RepID=A0A7C9D4I3_OPUST